VRIGTHFSGNRVYQDLDRIRSHLEYTSACAGFWKCRLVGQWSSQSCNTCLCCLRRFGFLVDCPLAQRLGWAGLRFTRWGRKRVSLTSPECQNLSGIPYGSTERTRTESEHTLANDVFRGRVLCYLGFCSAIPSSQGLGIERILPYFTGYRVNRDLSAVFVIFVTD
jgi:hypothetical protein